MKSLLSDLLFQSVAETVENTAFMEVKPWRVFWSRVAVLAPVTGCVTVSVHESLVAEFMETLTGVPKESQNEDVLLDVMAELTNTIAGRLLSAIVVSDCVFQLGLPERGVGDITAMNDDAAFHGCYEVNGHVFIVSVSGDALLDLAQVKKDGLATSPLLPPPATGAWGAPPPTSTWG